MPDLVKYIKDLEREFLESNQELKESNRIEFLRKRDDFVSERLIERKGNGED